MIRIVTSLLAVLAMSGAATGADHVPVSEFDDTRVEAAAPAAAEAGVAAAGDAAPAQAEAPDPFSGATDEIDLETTAIKGSQELPRVLVIVPWKKAQPGQIEGRPANSLLDEVLAPVDREVFARQIEFYRQITTENTED